MQESTSGDDSQDSFKERLLGRLESIGIAREKILKYFVLFIVLLLIYSVYLRSILETQGHYKIAFNAAALLAVLKFLILAGWPFAVIAFIDETWRSKEAAPIALAAFAGAVMFWFNKYGIRCFYGSVILFFPFLLSAAICHSFGTWRHKADVPED